MATPLEQLLDQLLLASVRKAHLAANEADADTGEAELGNLLDAYERFGGDRVFAALDRLAAAGQIRFEPADLAEGKAHVLPVE